MMSDTPAVTDAERAAAERQAVGLYLVLRDIAAMAVDWADRNYSPDALTVYDARRTMEQIRFIATEAVASIEHVSAEG